MISDPQRERIKVFLYLLIRNELPSGKVTELVNGVQESFIGGATEAKFTSKGIAIHAEELLDRLLDIK